LLWRNETGLLFPSAMTFRQHYSYKKRNFRIQVIACIGGRK
jgi:hypothetical protein